MQYCQTQMHHSEEDTNNHENRETDEVDHELEKIRLKRMESLLRQQQNAQRPNNVLTNEDKIRMILQAILTPEAFRYYLSIRDRDESVANRIVQFILPPEIMREIDLLIFFY